MAYVVVAGQTVSNRASLLSTLWTALSDMGWTLHDNMDGSSYRVYKSQGELSNQPAGYIKIDWLTTDKIKFTPFQWWNSSTHSGNSSAQFVVITSSGSSSHTVWIHGNKNLVWIRTYASSYDGAMFGHMPKKLWNVSTTLSSGATAGSNVTITVSSTTNFIAGNSYQIVGIAGEGRDWVTVSSITNSTQMVISSLPRDYGSGSFIGTQPSSFGAGDSTYFYPVSPHSAVGTSNYTTESVCSIASPVVSSSIDPDNRGNCVLLYPILLYGESDLETSFFGYIDDYFYGSPLSADNDTIGVTLQDSGTATSATSSTLVDSTKSWVTNVFTDKVAIITGGTGSGQIRKISSNTATTLTVSSNWDTTPSTDSTYSIYNEGYRLFSTPLGNTASKEGV